MKLTDNAKKGLKVMGIMMIGMVIAITLSYQIPQKCNTVSVLSINENTNEIVSCNGKIVTTNVVPDADIEQIKEAM